MDFDQLEVIIFPKTELNTKLDRKEVYFQLKVTITHLNRNIILYLVLWPDFCKHNDTNKCTIMHNNAQIHAQYCTIMHKIINYNTCISYPELDCGACCLLDLLYGSDIAMQWPETAQSFMICKQFWNWNKGTMGQGIEPNGPQNHCSDRCTDKEQFKYRLIFQRKRFVIKICVRLKSYDMLF